jgi:hypothetical protein
MESLLGITACDKYKTASDLHSNLKARYGDISIMILYIHHWQPFRGSDLRDDPLAI